MSSYWIAFKGELYKRMLLEKRYILEVLSDFLVYYLLFMGIFGIIRINVGSLSQLELNRLVSMQVVGYISWFFFSFTINFIHNGVTRELTEGTFEQLCINPNSILKVFFIKLLVGSLRNIILLLPLIILLTLSTGVMFSIDLFVVTVFAIMLIGTIGFSLLLGGLGVYYKRIGQLPFIISILFLGTSIIDMSQTSVLLQRIMNILPFAKGTEMIKQYISNGQLINNTDIALLVVNSLAYLLIGIFAFSFFFNKTRESGSLARF